MSSRHLKSASAGSEALLTLPTSQLLDTKATIACAFINKRSGAKLGEELIKVLEHMRGANPEEVINCAVHDLGEEDPEEVLMEYMKQWQDDQVEYLHRSLGDSMSGGEHVRNASKTSCGSLVSADTASLLTPVVLICGGDGTFSWVASAAIKCAETLNRQRQEEDARAGARNAAINGSPVDLAESEMKLLRYCCVPIPLGTGNDMSGVLGWGRSMKPSDCYNLLRSVEMSSVGPKCDVWGVKYKNFNSMNRFGTLCNYFSIGVDAKTSHIFERQRTFKPQLFRSQSFNKAAYGALGGCLAFKGSSSLGKRVKRLVVDGKEIDVPHKTKALVILNIPSYADGTKPWGIGSRQGFRDAAIDDGVLEVFCMRSILSIAFMKLIRGACNFQGGVKKLAQGSRVVLEMQPHAVWSKGKGAREEQHMFAQVDGEAFAFDCNEECISIHQRGAVPTLFGPHRGALFQGPPAKLKDGSFKARWPHVEGKGTYSDEA